MDPSQVLLEIVRAGPYLRLCTAGPERTTIAVASTPGRGMATFDVTVSVVGGGKALRAVAARHIATERFGVSVLVFSGEACFSLRCAGGRDNDAPEFGLGLDRLLTVVTAESILALGMRPLGQAQARETAGNALGVTSHITITIHGRAPDTRPRRAGISRIRRGDPSRRGIAIRRLHGSAVFYQARRGASLPGGWQVAFVPRGSLVLDNPNRVPGPVVVLVPGTKGVDCARPRLKPAQSRVGEWTTKTRKANLARRLDGSDAPAEVDIKGLWASSKIGRIRGARTTARPVVHGKRLCSH